MLKTRLITAFFLIPLILGSVYFGGLVFFALVTAALLVAGYELFEMARHAGHQPMPWLGLALIALILLDAHTQTDFARAILTAALVVSLTIGVLRPREGWLVGWAITVAGALYVGWLGAYFLLGAGVAERSDVDDARLGDRVGNRHGRVHRGHAIRRHRFFPVISPKKTWEGAIGGWIAAPLAMLALGWLFSLPLVHCALLGFLIGIAATFGDLAESLLKRQTGVKDSSNIVPGHGGILDRFDSLLFTAVVAYYYLVWILRVGILVISDW